jgi:RNA polymerase sigma-70 factor (ECF subfamily)
MQTADPSELLKRAKQGDMEAFAALFEPLRVKSLGIAARIVGPDEAPDVVMDAFLKAWKALPAFNERSSLATWLYRIVWNCSADHRRAGLRRRENRMAENEDGTAMDIADIAADTPLDNTSRRDLARQLEGSLGQLSEELRVTLLLRFSDGLSYREIAAATGVRIGTVMSRLFHGRRRLKTLMSEIESGENTP